MLKSHPLCKICSLIKENPKILKDIYNTNAYSKGTGISLAKLAEEYAGVFSYDNLKNHVKKHQFMSAADFKTRELRKIASQAERQILKKKMDSVNVWDTVVDMGMEKLENGELKMDMKDVLKATKDRSDYQFKKQDNELRLAEMVAFFTSGADNQELSRKYDRRIVTTEEVTDFDPTPPATRSLEEGENRPSSVHYPPSWDAAT